MTAQVRDWLPIEVASRVKVREAIDGVVLGWSEDWFAGQRLQATRFRPVTEGLRLRGAGETWRAYRGPVALSVTPQAGSRLVSWALDAPLSRLELTPGDTAVIEALEHAILDDLIERIETLLGLPAAPPAGPARVDRLFGGGEGVEVAVTDATGALVVSLALPFDAVLPLSKASLPAAKRALDDIDGLTGALGRTAVALEATLGHVEIGVVDLRKLAKGDVLVLDRELEAGIRFDVPGSDQPFAVARLGEAEGRMTLTLEREQD